MNTRYCFFFFFFNDTATTEIYTLSLHDALPIYEKPVLVRPARDGHLHLVVVPVAVRVVALAERVAVLSLRQAGVVQADRKSTRLNSSHANISYAVFCLKKKKTYKNQSSNDEVE